MVEHFGQHLNGYFFTGVLLLYGSNHRALSILLPLCTARAAWASYSQVALQSFRTPHSLHMPLHLSLRPYPPSHPTLSFRPFRQRCRARLGAELWLALHPAPHHCGRHLAARGELNRKASMPAGGCRLTTLGLRGPHC